MGVGYARHHAKSTRQILVKHMIDLPQLLECTPNVSPVLMEALVRAESNWNPYAIGPDSGEAPVEQPRTLEQAVAKAKALKASGVHFSIGLAQIHVSNVASMGMTWEDAFDVCKNLALGQAILMGNYRKAIATGYAGIDAVWAALRGYNNGDVHRAVSDAYAQKIFLFMQQQQQKENGSAGRAARTTPASANPVFVGLEAVAQIQPPGLAARQAQAGPSAKDGAARKSESAEIFQADEKQGF
jgi:type IV secretion system protein VirB1